MATLIAYATRYGCTEKCAKMLAERLKGTVDICDLKKGKDVDPAAYDTVIVGGSMYMGRILKQVPAFLRKYAEVLKGKKTAYFLSAMAEKEVLKEELKNAFPEELRAGALAVACFGGECIISKLKPFHKFIFTKVAKSEEDKSTLNVEAIERFADALNQA